MAYVPLGCHRILYTRPANVLHCLALCVSGFRRHVAHEAFDACRRHLVRHRAEAKLHQRAADADFRKILELGRDGRELKTIRVTIAESPVARAWYEAPLW